MDEIKHKTGKMLIQLGNAVTWFRNQKMRPMELTSSQSGVIQYIQNHSDEKTTAGNIITRLYLSKPTISKIMKLLEKKSMIERNVDESDFRRRVIVLTEKGVSLETDLRKIDLQTEEILLYGMTEKEKAQFGYLLQMALDNMNTYREGFLRQRKRGKQVQKEIF